VDARWRGLAVLEAHAAAEALQGLGRHGAAHLGAVHAVDGATRVEEPRGQGAVVGEEEEAARVQVEAADRVEPR